MISCSWMEMFCWRSSTHLHLFLLDLAAHLRLLQAISHLCLCLGSVHLCVICSLVQLKVPLGPGDFCIILKLGFHPLLFSMSFGDSCIPSRLGLADHCIAFHLRSPGLS